MVPGHEGKKVGFVAHALALDEIRESFLADCWVPRGVWMRRFKEDWFPGSHGNAGDGYADHNLSNIAFFRVMTCAEHHGLRQPTLRQGARRRAVDPGRAARPPERARPHRQPFRPAAVHAPRQERGQRLLEADAGPSLATPGSRTGTAEKDSPRTTTGLANLVTIWCPTTFCHLRRGASILNPQSQREGVVLRPLVEEHDEDIGGRLSFKVINPKFLLKYDE